MDKKNALPAILFLTFPAVAIALIDMIPGYARATNGWLTRSEVWLNYSLALWMIGIGFSFVCSRSTFLNVGVIAAYICGVAATVYALFALAFTAGLHVMTFGQELPVTQSPYYPLHTLGRCISITFDDGMTKNRLYLLSSSDRLVAIDLGVRESISLRSDDISRIEASDTCATD